MQLLASVHAIVLACKLHKSSDKCMEDPFMVAQDPVNINTAMAYWAFPRTYKNNGKGSNWGGEKQSTNGMIQGCLISVNGMIEIRVAHCQMANGIIKRCQV